MVNRMSVATSDSPEFINIESVNPLISKCEIKVLYVGENRNNSFITKEVATNMAKTLPGCPIVGYFIEKKEDFGDHGEQVIIDGEGVKFNKLTKPYGFVDINAKVWFQKFEDTDEFGNTVVREYLMTEGYLWTGQYEECQRVISEGNPQSMELDEKTLKGYWSNDSNRGVEFFIINDGMFSKLCILGEDVEPCFEGASVTSPEVSSKFSKDENFTKTLFSMVQELKELTFQLQEKGGSPMPEEMKAEEFTEANAPQAEPEVAIEQPAENFSAEEGKSDSEVTEKIDNITEEFAKKDEEDKKEEKEDSKEEKADDEDTDKNDDSKKEDDDDEDKKKKFALMETELEELKTQYASLKAENEALIAFKNAVEDEKKTDLINSFYMLSDEDKKDVIENKSKYSLEDIEAKLSVICVRNKVNFSSDNKKEENNEIVFNIDSVEDHDYGLPAWVQRVQAVAKEKNL